MFRKHKSATRLAIESLEHRLLLAGDVTAYLDVDHSGSETVLVVEGDNQANQIRVVEDIPGHACIEGLDDTTVNGMAADELFYDSGRLSSGRID